MYSSAAIGSGAGSRRGLGMEISVVGPSSWATGTLFRLADGSKHIPRTLMRRRLDPPWEAGGWSSIRA